MLRIRLDKTAVAGAVVEGRRCNLDCIWCHHDYFDHSDARRPAISNEAFVDGVTRVLRVTEARHAVVRIAGNGEPTLVGRTELVGLVSLLRMIPEVREVKLTTNGVLLQKMAEPLKAAGLDSVTISLNSLDRDAYYLYAGRDGLGDVLDSISLCSDIGLPAKINVLYTRLNSRELDGFLELARQQSGLVVKFFDLIPASDLDERFYLPLGRLERQLSAIADGIKKFEDAYSYREYSLPDDQVVRVKLADENNCPNMSCPARNECLEGCRSSVRIRVDGVLQPCGVRTDNMVDLLAPKTTNTRILDCLRSGGKASDN